MRRSILVLAAGLLLAACGTAPQAAGSAAQPPATTAATAAELQAVAEATFPKVEEYGYYGVCGLTGDLAACPYTERLKARLGELKDTLMRSQTPSNTRVIAVEPTATGGIAHVGLFDGRQTVDLVIVRQGDQLLVDDETCAGRPDTSVYAAEFRAC